MDRLPIWPRIRTLLRTSRPRWRFAARVTASGLLAYAAAQVMRLPLQGLWMILTAIVVTQASAGGSVRATLQYIIGTVGGAVYAAILGILIPHGTPLVEIGVLALPQLPSLGLVAAFNPALPRGAVFGGAGSAARRAVRRRREAQIESALYGRPKWRWAV